MSKNSRPSRGSGSEGSYTPRSKDRNPADYQVTHAQVPPDVLKASEVARMAAVGPETVRRWARSGALPRVILPTGGQRFLLSDVRKLLGLDKVGDQ